MLVRSDIYANPSAPMVSHLCLKRIRKALVKQVLYPPTAGPTLAMDDNEKSPYVTMMATQLAPNWSLYTGRDSPNGS